MTGGSILIIDDEPGIRRTLASILEDEHYHVITAEDAIAGLQILKNEKFALVFLDVLMPRMGGIEALEHIRREHAETEVVMISGHANIDMAVRAVKLGAFDFLEKPVSLDKVLTVSRNAMAIKNLKEENRILKNKNAQSVEIIGVSQEIVNIRKFIEQAAASDARILISGENGTGKEVAAREIHRLSNRADKPFIEINCAAIPDTLIESELFGHEKGAFTDAHSQRKGRFEIASGGTLFMDEIGDMSLTAQAKVLRAIQDQKIVRLGGDKTIEVDVRILAATNQDLEQASKSGRFRQDLYFRLNVIPIKIPSLRERAADIPLLLEHFLKQISPVPVELDESAITLLMEYPWPGNVRELKNFAERLGIMYPGSHINEKIVTELLNISASDSTGKNNAEMLKNSGTAVPPVEDLLNNNYSDAKEIFEKLYLEFQLSKNSGIINRTAEAIGMYPSNLHAKIRKYGIKSGN